MPPHRMDLTRRAAIAGLAASPALSLPITPTLAQEAASPARFSPSCILTPQAVDGPYYFDPGMQRSDITEGHPGAPLRLRFVAIDVATCRPLAGARVDVWHARADGLYSGYAGQGDDHGIDTSGGTFMRGTQTTDSRGEVAFRTVYPGWYEGRTTHIHFKVFADRKNVLTGQMYFPDALSQYLYANVSAYGRKTARDTFNANDGLALMDKAHGGFCDIREQPDHYLATLILGVDRAAVLADNMSGFPPPGPPPGARPGMRPPRRTPAAIVPGVAQNEQKTG
ncbi:protocatechuate 3,4-dioxygenase beta subunit [Nitrobacteraceae bacterium AZCC 2161]